MTPYERAWVQAMGDVVRLAGVSSTSNPTMDEVSAAAQALGITVPDLLEVAQVHARYCLATVQN